VSDPTASLPEGTSEAGERAADVDAGREAASMRTVPLRPGALGPVTEQRFGGAGGPGEGDPDRAERLVGRVLAGRYEVRRVLGRGGMGLVYEARHITVGRSVAIKVLRQDLARSTDAVARFHREARAAAAVGSEHIVEVFDFGYTEDGDAYIAMELLEGEDLGALVRRSGPLMPQRALAIARQVARALEMAHAKGIVHRDLKSENVFVLQRQGEEFVKLLDFGISKVSEGDGGRGPMTSEGVVMGTPHYMAPEQIESSMESDHRIDLYALGCVLYETLTARLPFTGRNPIEVVFKHVHEAPTPPSRWREGLSPDLDAVVLHALEKDRGRRYQSAAEMLSALSAVAEGSGSGLIAASPIRTPRGRRHRPLLTGLALGSALLAAAFAWTRPPARSETTGRTAGASTTDPRPVADASSAVPEAVLERPDPVEPAAPLGAIAITVSPRSATISLDGALLGAGSASVQGPDGQRHRLLLQAPGFVSQEYDLVLDRPGTLAYTLVRASAGGVPTRARREPSGANDSSGARTAPLVPGPSGRDPVALDPADGLKGSPYGRGTARR
jgi:serine/threonine protein kinase